MNPKRFLAPMLAAALIGAAVASTLAAASAGPVKRATNAPRRPHVARTAQTTQRPVNATLVRRLRHTAWRWQSVLGIPRARSAASLRSPRALQYWRGQVRRVRFLASHPPHKRGWLCIHRFEGGWADDGDPYWGGLQMDRSFMRAYAPAVLLRRGWANRWTPLEQMWVAERAHRSGRGYTPWPNTARFCGLL